ncbi:MAG: hypothetical protein WBM93_07565, partial [Parasphingorhabdus sp.]
MDQKLFAIFVAIAAWSIPAAVQATSSPSSAQVDFEAQIADTKSNMMSDPAAALQAARTAAVTANKMPKDKAIVAIATSQWLEGEALTRLNKAKLAEPVITAALETITRADPDSKLHADLLKSRAAIISQTGKVESAL